MSGLLLNNFIILIKYILLVIDKNFVSYLLFNSFGSIYNAK